MSLMPCKGERPWLPSWDAEDPTTLLEVEVPLVGTFRAGTTTYLFSCMLGDLSRLAVWGYVPMTAADLDFIESRPFGTPEELRTWVDARVYRDATRSALSWDDVIQVHGDVDRTVGMFDSVDLLLDLFGESKKPMPYVGRAESGPIPLVGEYLEVKVEVEKAHEEMREVAAAAFG